MATSAWCWASQSLGFDQGISSESAGNSGRWMSLGVSLFGLIRDAPKEWSISIANFTLYPSRQAIPTRPLTHASPPSTTFGDLTGPKRPGPYRYVLCSWPLVHATSGPRHYEAPPAVRPAENRWRKKKKAPSQMRGGLRCICEGGYYALRRRRSTQAAGASNSMVAGSGTMMSVRVSPIPGTSIVGEPGVSAHTLAAFGLSWIR